MSRYPAAVWRPVPYTGLHARQPRRAMLLHTNGGGAQLYGWWTQKAKAGSHLGAQYQVFRDGRVECYVDPSLVVYHAYSASEWAIGVETEDDGNPGTPWTLPQIQAIAAIGRYHEIPAAMLSGTAPGDGVGYHQQHTEWNQSAHDCPGHVRVAQIPQILAAMSPATVTARTTHPPTRLEDDMTRLFSYKGKHYLTNFFNTWNIRPSLEKVLAGEGVTYVTLTDADAETLIAGAK